MSQDMYQEVTQRIVDALENCGEWDRPWTNLAQIARRANGQPYQGVNVLLLAIQSFRKGYRNPVWMTYKQAQIYKANVRKGEKGTAIIFFKALEKKEKNAAGNDEVKHIPLLRGYTVFNVEQIDGLPVHFYAVSEVKLADHERDARLDRFLKATGASVEYGGDRACYNPLTDAVRMPELGQFKTAESFYATHLHELVHWTSPKDRCDRQLGLSRGDEGYAFEELVAEIGAAFLCAHFGITSQVEQNHAAYVKSWLKALKGDKRYIFKAASAAQKAANYLLAITGETEELGYPEEMKEAA